MSKKLMCSKLSIVLAVCSLVILVGCKASIVKQTQKTAPLTAKQARIQATGYDKNRPDHFPGLGDFIGWAGAIERMPNGDILLAHSAGYWHCSFASPRQIEPKKKAEMRKVKWPVDFPAPTGGRCMLVRSTDNGKTWSRPKTLIDYYLNDRPDTLFTCKDGTVLCVVNVQASWNGYLDAPKQFEKDIDGLNTKQFVLRSTNSGKTWSKPIWLDCPGTRYELSHGGPIQLDDGSILLATYCTNKGQRRPFGAIHRSMDSGKTWETISVINRKDKSEAIEPLGIDEPAITQLKDGRLMLVTRVDGGLFYSSDKGVTWVESGVKILQPNQRGLKFKAPQLFVLKDGTVVTVATMRNLRVWLSKDNGKTWTKDIPLDTSCYGYPGGMLLDDESVLVSYCQSGVAPNRVYVIRFKVNKNRDGIELLPIGEPTKLAAED